MQQAVDTPPQGSTMTTTTGPSEVGTTAAPQPPIGRYRRAPVQVHQADPDPPEVARHLTALIATRWPATPAEHIGSSAVAGLAGKNIIDLLPAAPPAGIPATTPALVEPGFPPHGPAAFPATRPMLWGPFGHGPTTYRVHVHVVPAGSPEVAALCGFRDALRADPVLRRRYAALKRAIAAGGPVDPVAFTTAKHHWIAATLTRLGLAGHQPRRLYQEHPDLDRPTDWPHDPPFSHACLFTRQQIREVCQKSAWYGHKTVSPHLRTPVIPGRDWSGGHSGRWFVRPDSLHRRNVYLASVLRTSRFAGDAVTIPKPRTATDPRRWWALALVRGAFCTVLPAPVIMAVALPSTAPWGPNG